MKHVLAILLGRRGAKLGWLLLASAACSPQDPMTAKSFDFDTGPATYSSSSFELEDNRSFYKLLFPGDTYSILWNELDGFRSATAVTQRVPYQDSWYPESQGGTNVRQALNAYDAAFASSAGAWEARNHSETDKEKHWFGHCNGASVASIRYESPRRSAFRPYGCTKGRPGCIEFSPGTIRALLAEISMNVAYKFIGGNKCTVSMENLANQPRSDYARLDSCGDVNPATFHVALINYLGRKGQPLIHDSSYGDMVWNYPIYTYAYQARAVTEAEAVQLSGITGNKWIYNGQARGWMKVDMNIGYRDFDSTFTNAGGFPAPKAQPLSYILELDQGGQIIGGEWIGGSKTLHPDFIWIPFESNEPVDDRSLSNPFVAPANVLRLWAESIDRDPNVPFPEQTESWRVLFYPRDSELNEWGQNPFYRIVIDGRTSGAAFLEPNKEIDLTVGVVDDIKNNTSFTAYLNGKAIGTAAVASGRGSIKMKPRAGVNTISLRWTTNATDPNGLNREFNFYAM